MIVATRPDGLDGVASVGCVKYLAVDVNSVLGKSSLQEAYGYLMITIRQPEQRVKPFFGSRNRDLSVNGFLL